MKTVISLSRYLVISLCLVLLGCGYTTRSNVSSKYRTIYITPFINKIELSLEDYSANKYRIYRPLLETDVTKSVINKFLFDGNLRPVKEGAADLVLKGELTEFRKDPLRYDDDNNITEYRVNIVVNLSLWDNKENKLSWEESGFSGNATFFITGSQAKSEGQAVNEALDDLARRIVERAVEQW